MTELLLVIQWQSFFTYQKKTFGFVHDSKECIVLIVLTCNELLTVYQCSSLLHTDRQTHRLRISHTTHRQIKNYYNKVKTGVCCEFI